MDSALTVLLYMFYNSQESGHVSLSVSFTCSMSRHTWTGATIDWNETVTVQLKKVMVVGIDTYHDSSRKGRSCCGIVASTNDSFTQYYSTVTFQMSHLELQDKLCTAMTCEWTYWIWTPWNETGLGELWLHELRVNWTLTPWPVNEWVELWLLDLWVDWFECLLHDPLVNWLNFDFMTWEWIGWTLIPWSMSEVVRLGFHDMSVNWLNFDTFIQTHRWIV